MTKIKRLGVDFDDVCVEMYEPLLFWHNREYGTNVELHQAFTHHLSQLWKCEPQESHQRVQEFIASPDHKGLQPVSNMQSVLEVLKRKVSLVIITHRSDTIEEFTHELIDMHYKDVFDKVIHTDYKATDGVGKSKGLVAKEEGFDALLDDVTGNALSIHEEIQKPAFLRKRPWNLQDRKSGTIPTAVTFYDNPLEILGHIS